MLAYRNKPDLVLLDLLIPAGNGMSVLRRLHQSYRMHGIPVVILTSIVDEQCEQLAFETGAVSYMHKPYKEEELIANIKKLI